MPWKLEGGSCGKISTKKLFRCKQGKDKVKKNWNRSSNEMEGNGL